MSRTWLSFALATVAASGAALGSVSYAQPVVAGRKVYVGTNNANPRNPRDTRKRRDGKTEPSGRTRLAGRAQQRTAFPECCTSCSWLSS